MEREYKDIKKCYKDYLERIQENGYGLSTQRLRLDLYRIENKNKPIIIEIDEMLYTSKFEVDSWRGSYNLPALSYETLNEKSELSSVNQAIIMLREVEGKVVSGYKGGEYTLDENDTLYVANYGCSNGALAIIDIVELDSCVLLKTKYDMY